MVGDSGAGGWSPKVPRGMEALAVQVCFNRVTLGRLPRLPCSLPSALVSYLKLAVDDKTKTEIMFNESRIYLSEQEIKDPGPQHFSIPVEKLKCTDQKGP